MKSTGRCAALRIVASAACARAHRRRTPQRGAPFGAPQGKMVYTSGNVYEGQWKRNVKSGYGEMRWASTAEVYKGQWADGLQEGEGEHEWLRPQNDGHALQLRERYAGKWHKGQRSGQGIFVYANGSAYRGGWRANLKHGEGVFMFEDGSSCAGLFEDDRMLDASSVMQPVRAHARARAARGARAGRAKWGACAAPSRARWRATAPRCARAWRPLA